MLGNLLGCYGLGVGTVPLAALDWGSEEQLPHKATPLVFESNLQTCSSLLPTLGA